ncbi:hypothetical protein SKAU_G00036690 [Synaphobranchus kaupii]|uniref:Uncharacterized protein n=1 Tax=Synaphobranchus kaupii TaxID=118154 RepID=A0A9Q1GEP4_SYNKA|nr:hypothetical protein SKAU_G00036690 [Synaphobranchus kaupii]
MTSALHNAHCPRHMTKAQSFLVSCQRRGVRSTPRRKSVNDIRGMRSCDDHGPFLDGPRLSRGPDYPLTLITSAAFLPGDSGFILTAKQ